MSVVTVPPLDTQLTDEQLAAVNSDAPALVVTSPAGTGKTEVLVRRAERYVSDPANGNRRVLVVTYTTRAAEEFTSRLRHRITGSMHRLTAETLHAFCQALLSVHGGHIGLPLDFQVIAKDEDRAELLARHDAAWCLDDGPQLFRELDLARARGDGHSRLALWRAALKDAGAVDYCDMISIATQVLRIPAIATMQRNIYGMVLIDEAQNLTPQQYEFVAALIGCCPAARSPQVPTTLLGDPNQLVTGFAGGDSSQMRRFASEFGAQKLSLSQNFRSSRRLASLEAVVARRLDRNEGRQANGATSAVTGAINVHDLGNEHHEGEFVAKWVTHLLTEGLPPEARMPAETVRLEPEEIAVLARHAASLGAVSKALAERGHEVAAAHNGDDLMCTAAGKAALLLMRARSDRHRLEATSELSRNLQINLPELGDTANGDTVAAAAESFRAADVEHLVPLLDARSPEAFVDALDGCGPPRNARSELLSGWAADRFLLEHAWGEFANITPTSERSWTRFALHFDRMARGRDLGTGIRLLTVHKAQAREFKAVAIVAMNDGQFPDFRATTTEQQTAELQTFYVAATRASRALLLTRARTRPTRYGDRPTEPSPFLQLVKQAVDNHGP